MQILNVAHKEQVRWRRWRVSVRRVFNVGDEWLLIDCFLVYGFSEYLLNRTSDERAALQKRGRPCNTEQKPCPSLPSYWFTYKLTRSRLAASRVKTLRGVWLWSKEKKVTIYKKHFTCWSTRSPSSEQWSATDSCYIIGLSGKLAKEAAAAICIQSAQWTGTLLLCLLLSCSPLLYYVCLLSKCQFFALRWTVGSSDQT